MSGRGGPGGNSRGRGGKFKKFTRGGGKHFSRDLRPLDADGNEISMWSADAKKKDSDDDSEDSGEESEEDSDEDSGVGPSNSRELTREERKQQKAAAKAAAIAKKKKAQIQVGDMPTDSEEESDDDMPANPNHSKASRNMTKQPAATVEEVAEAVKNLATKPAASMSRKERESMEAAAAKERYRKLHEAGKTDEAQADLARLRLIREKREAESARKQAEKEEREAQEAAKKAEIEAKEAKKRVAALGKPGKKGKGK
ncbi:casein kinase substrate phospho protein PP28-domain-containing protein [Pseudomassariella vexata]|uniref:Casein kinase substrate phospho protein PP28-domain-containing protein n=1 Tax=Pseudomassariella vexata TaxID=1141098 RepID=A0A1Y2E6G7_9PEZI|nr:casein kinase substrate phospho protein PP28-domain-containing protein [Pseudomassariella vexata]ORY67037.1 casein kinase substrate phospho protein PP28-domain-containing protein [Pseudomassariella vexata]